MIAPAALREMLCRAVVATPLEDGVRVSTHVLYPSNGAVSVVVRGGTDSFVVSDDGGAIAELISSGVRTFLADYMIKARVKHHGLRVSECAILSPSIPMEALPAAIMLVANASKSVAEWGLKTLRYHPPRNFRADLATLLGKHFGENLKQDSPIVGASNKPHKFAHVIYLSGDRKLLVDPVYNDASSVNARLVANLDVRMANNPLIDQIIVFDDEAKWQASDLKLLEMGAATVAFSHVEPEIVRRVA